MMLINVRFDVKPEFADSWLEITRDFTEATRAEPGNLWFDWYRSPDAETTFLLCEAFRDGDAPAEHVGSAHFREFTGSAAQYLQRTPRIINTTVDGEEWGTMGEITVD
ncbi:antibiotic biosynthesis monooxygenase [Dietzia sp. Cai40]|uniref:putative quinol monooxygenase n=2 Tax=Dietziaceae TaxID=85029 RepID=UPI0015F83F14|nr:putative quinol monooxygenase [Dietzia sp. Cai40]MBB1042037.1 antibiotic biosynthesis monooxygenase [Dietzia sp. Cai40]MBC7297169.1 antibiotic biosynthesis monooxygenase [Dietzia sp.]